MRDRSHRRCCIGRVLAGGLLVAASCRQSSDSEADKTATKRAASATRQAADVLVFPDELKVDDHRINAFVADAMHACGRGEYEAFRGYWSSAEEPLPRGEFEQGWQAVRSIRIRALREARLVRSDDEPDGSPERGREEQVFVVLATVELDPAHPAGQREPKRDVALLLVDERGEWRLARPTKNMRDWIRAEVEKSEANTVNPSEANARATSRP